MLFVLLLILAWHFRGKYEGWFFSFLKAVIQFHMKCNYLHQRDVDFYTWAISVKVWLVQQDFFFIWEILKVMALQSDADMLSFVDLPSHSPFEHEKGYFFPRRGKVAVLHTFPLMGSCSVWTIKPKINKACFYLGAQSSQTPST